ncbi:hypothetical protein DOZ80_19430 [Pseudomonas fluorescens]|uniref:Uncharacterized protein n=1 Tax=Pseudomonas fluorescens TaxID=294 RepID=A0A327MWW8_PSEFL|nr:hypothetical protein DOZ80_19430 [Pseudomonas fluorescens]
MLAMVVNDDVGRLTPRGVLGCIASKLAPTMKSAFFGILSSRYNTLCCPTLPPIETLPCPPRA